MAINPESQYPGKIAPSTPEYPYGAARNITLPGDGTGTPWEAALVNDIFGFQQALLSLAGVVPSGTPENATLSQYLEAFRKLFPFSLAATTLALTKDLSAVSGFSSQGYASIFDQGGGFWKATGNTVPGSAGTTDFPNGLLYDSVGTEFLLSSPLPTPRMIGATVDGVTNNSTQVNNLLLFRGAAPILLDEGTYPLQDIALQAASTVLVQNATLKPFANDTMFEMIQGARIMGIGGAKMVGSGKASGNTLEIGVRISGDGECVVEGFDSFEDFGGDAILVREHVNLHEGSRIQGFVVKNNRNGVTLENRGEYCIVTALTVFGNTNGIICKGGNNKIVNNTISDNDLGLWIQNGDNDAHGIVANNTINHNTVNIRNDLTTVDEMLFSDNAIYAGQIWLNGCVGSVFSGGLIESSAQILEEGCTEIVFDGVKFPGGINNSPNHNGSASLVIYRDAILPRSISATTGQSINGSYSEVKRSGQTTVNAGTSTTSVYNSTTFNSVTANTSMTVETLYDNVDTWDPVNNVVERGFLINSNIQLSVARIGADVDIANVHFLVVDATNENLILGVGVASPQNILTGDVRTHTFVLAGHLERRAFKVKLINNSASNILILGDQTDARSRAIVMDW